MANIMLTYWYQLYTKQTKQERALEKELAKLGVRYRCQHPFLSVRAIVDFLLPDYNLVIEVDDPGHLRKKNIKKDRERTERLTGLGLRVIRYTNEEVDTQLSRVVESIKGEVFSKPLDIKPPPSQKKSRKKVRNAPSAQAYVQ